MLNIRPVCSRVAWGWARRVLRLCPTVLCRAIRLSLFGQCPYRPEPRRSGDGRATRHRQTRPVTAVNRPSRVLLADDWRPRRTTSCRKCNRTRCRRKYAIGWRPRSPDRWRARGARATTSPSSSRWRTPSGPAYSWTACTAGWSPRRWWRSPPTWSKYSRSVPSPTPCCCLPPLPPPSYGPTASTLCVLPLNVYRTSRHFSFSSLLLLFFPENLPSSWLCATQTRGRDIYKSINFSEI